MSLASERASIDAARAKAARQAKELAERHVSQDVLALYHIMKGASELASRVFLNNALLPEDEQRGARKAAEYVVAAFGQLDKLIADRGNDTPHEKRQSGD